MKTVAIIPVRINGSSTERMLGNAFGMTPLERTATVLKLSSIFHEILIVAADEEHADYYTEIARKTHAKLFIGEPEDLNKRIRKGLQKFGFSDGVAVRVNAENMFILPTQIEKMVESHFEKNADYTYSSDAPNGLVPDVVSIPGLLEFSGTGKPYYLELRNGATGRILNRIEYGIPKEKISFTALEQFDAELAKQITITRQLKTGLNEFLMEAREIYRTAMEQAPVKKKRDLNLKLNSIESALMLEHLYSMPPYLGIGTSSLCNLKCNTCLQQFSGFTEDEFQNIFDGNFNFLNTTFEKTANGSYKKKTKALSPEAFSHIEKVFFPYTKECCFGAYGEPLLNENFAGYIEKAKSWDIFTRCISNGMLLSGDKAKRLSSGILDAITISFDGAKKETFESIRIGSDFDRICGNIHSFAELAKCNGKKNTLITLGVTISTVNIRELPDIVRLARKLGADTVFACYAVTTPFMKREHSLYSHMEEVAEILHETRIIASREGIAVDLPRTSLDAPTTGKTCLYPWEQVAVIIGGMIQQCYLISHMETMNGQGFSAIWNGDFFKKLRRSFAGKEPLIENCVNCSLDVVRDHTNKKSFFITADDNPY